ncbi:MAG TPA: gliding motility-associated C-terminal domain-containing protein, partial [Bacteroidia bacterium]|nr:gliding motility-associated C-terminal domain-containing protein [Bacteroidia bacterium]
TTTSLAATTPIVGSGNWQVISGSSTVTNPANPSSAVNGLSLGTNQFVWTVSNGTCAASSDTVTVFVDEAPSPANAGTNQIICSSSTNLAATIPAIGNGVWTIVSGTGVFANIGDAATSVSGIINDTNIYRWTVDNGICPSVFSDVMIVVASNPPAADAGPNDTICGNSTLLNANVSAIGVGTWTLISGSGNFVNANVATTLVNNLGVGDNIFRWTIDNPPCTPTFDDVTIHVTSIPAIADAGRDTIICSEDSIVLYGNNPNSQSKKWTILSGGGGSFSAGLDTLANSVFHGIPDSTYVLRWTLSNPPCSDSFDDVVITFLRAPSTSNAGSNQNGASTCGLTTLSLAANTPNSGVGTWSVQSGSGGTIQSINSSNSLFSGVSGGTYLLTWTIANTCGSSQSDILITFNQKPDTALAGNDSTICASTIQLGANIPSFGTGFWKSITGSEIFSDTLLPNSTISNLSAGIHTLVWEITSPVCGSSYDTLTIQVDSLPTVLFAGNNQTICDSSSIVALNATAASIGNSYWSVISGSGTFQNPTLFNSTVSQLSYGNNLLAWNVSNGVCPIVTDTLIVSVDTPPSAANAGNNRIVCTNFVVLKADSITSGTGLWTQTLGTGANIAQPNNDTTLVNQLQLGLNSFTWTVSNGVCPSNSDTVYVDVNQASSAAVAGADTLICESTDSISIHALAPVFGIGSWKVLIGPSIISDSLQATTYIKNLQKGLNKIVWTVRNGLCSDFDVVNILVDSLPTPSSAGLVPAVCETSSSVVLAANQAITGVGQWSSASGIPVFADTNLATSSVSNLLIGTNELFWTISNGACLGVSSSVTVQVDQMLDTAKAGIDIRSCEGFSQLTLSADSPLVGIGYWTKLSGPLNVLDTANAHTALTGSATAPYSSSFSWTTSNGVCPLMVDTVSVLIDAFPSSSFAGINDTICATNIQLNASVPLVGLGQWSSLAGTIQFADTNLATSSASGLSIGSNTLYWTVSNGVCADSVSSVNIFVDQAPSTALAGADISACENTSGIALNAQAPAVGSGNWTVLSGSFQLVNSSQANSALQNIGPGNTVFLWTVVNGVCPSSSDTVSVTVSAIPSNAVVGANQILCENAALVNVSAITPTSGTGSWSVIQGGGSVLSPTSSTTQVTFNKGINAYAYTISNGACPSSVDTAYVTIDSISALAFAGNDLIICENATAISLNATFVNYGVAQWTSLTPGISIVNPAQNNTAISGVVLGSNKLVWTSSNGVCPANSDTVEIIVSALPSVATAGSNQNWCDTITQIQLQGNVPQIGSGVWIPISGSGTLSNPGSANTTVSGLQVGSAVFEWVISSGACTDSRDTVSITINASPTPSNAGTNQNYCINSNAITLNGNVPTIGTGTWSLLSGSATIDNVSQANSNIQVADSGNYIFNWTITNGVCQSSSSTTIHIDALPSPANAGADITANTPAVFLNAEIPQIGTGAWLLYQGTGTISDINNPTTQVSGLTQGTTVLSWTVSNGACAYSADEITISYLDLAIPNAISPNNDGINDAFVVPGLEYYSDVKFTLFNSWGTIVYESSDYKNDFAGITNSGQKLIDDTYYFVLQISSDLEYKGYLIIKK